LGLFYLCAARLSEDELICRKEAMMLEIEAKGRLESIKEPGKFWPVKYHFDIITTQEKKQGLAGVSVVRRSESRGWILSIDRTPIRQGKYNLYTQDGEVLRVDYFGGVWSIVSNP
jgi:hypothetical protein